MPIPEQPGKIAPLILFLLSVLASPAQAFEQGKPLHRSADRELWDRKTNRMELFGHAVVRQPGENLSADYIAVDLTNRTLDARGNCVYIAPDAVIYGDEMHFNMDTRTGTIVGGRVQNEKFSLSGERINKLGDGRFQTHWGEYTTCQDCPQSWIFQAEDVDMEFEGYAYMKNVNTKIKDAPAFWLPYLVIPLKTRRQTGFLFPTISASGVHGFSYVQPFFWAISRSSDMTVGAGIYTARGLRGEWEGRYALAPRSRGTADVYYLHDREPTLSEPTGYGPLFRKHRWGIDINQVQELPFGVEEKLHLTEMSDNVYPIQIGDVAQNGAGGWNNDPYVQSMLSFTYGSPYFRGYLAGSRIRNLLAINPNNPNAGAEPEQFDQRTVQVLPTATVTTNDKFLFGSPVATGLTFGLTNFTRTAGPTDPDVTGVMQGDAVLRQATRFTINPSMYTTFRPWDVFSLVPSVQYRGYAYSFHQAASNLYRQYLLVQVDLSTQLERIYDLNESNVSRRKHLIRPELTYSFIPFVSEPGQNEHTFIRQVTQQAGYEFDDNDIIPRNNDPANYTFVPLGNSISAGLSTQLIDRYGAADSESPSYVKSLELSAAQTLSIRDLQNSRPAWSRFFSNMDANLFGKLISSTTYYYYPFREVRRPDQSLSPARNRNQISTSLTYVLEQGLHQRILDFSRSVTFGYSYNQLDCVEASCGTSALNSTIRFSLSDYFLPALTYGYDFIAHNWSSAGLNLLYQSPSRCWRLSLNIAYTRDTKSTRWSPDLTLNLTGTGFGGVTELTSLGTPTKQ